MSLKSSKFRFASILVAAMAIGVFAGVTYTRYTSQRQFIEVLKMRDAMPNNKVDATLQLISGYYVDDISTDTLVESMLPKIVEQLDPHSSYIPAKDMAKMNEPLDGEFDGVGVVFNMATDTVIILNVIPSGPSSKAGVMARDRIIQINDTLVAGQKVSQESIMRRLRGVRGTKVKLGIERGGIDELVDIEVVRDKIPIHSISSSFVITDSIGYIKLDQFARTTYKEFIEAINKLRADGMGSLILDLRGNSGGFMDQAIHLANEFLPDTTLIVYTESRGGVREHQYSDRDGQLQDLPLAVLIDEGSASSSEILAGALQDNDKGIIIGRRSFGKGLVQQQIPFTDGSALRLTIARYFTPTGRSIQKPYEMGNAEDYGRDLIRRIEHEELFTADSIAFADSLRFVTPKGRVVYGGGGIMPDIFVPLSKEKLPKFFTEVVGRNILYLYTIEYSDRHRDELAKVVTLTDLDLLFARDRNLLSDFVAFAKSKGVEASAAEIKAARELIERQLKGYIGRNTELSDVGFYANIYPLDDVLMRAIETLSE